MEKSDFHIYNLQQEIDEQNAQIEAAEQRERVLVENVRELDQVIRLQSRENNPEIYEVLVETRSVKKQLPKLEKNK
jgi:hypothetical protein